MPHRSRTRRRGERKVCEGQKESEECSSHLIVSNVSAQEIRAPKIMYVERDQDVASAGALR